MVWGGSGGGGVVGGAGGVGSSFGGGGGRWAGIGGSGGDELVVAAAVPGGGGDGEGTGNVAVAVAMAASARAAARVSWVARQAAVEEEQKRRNEDMEEEDQLKIRMRRMEEVWKREVEDFERQRKRRRRMEAAWDDKMEKWDEALEADEAEALRLEDAAAVVMATAGFREEVEARRTRKRREAVWSVVRWIKDMVRLELLVAVALAEEVVAEMETTTEFMAGEAVELAAGDALAGRIMGYVVGLDWSFGRWHDEAGRVSRQRCLEP